MTEQEQNIAIAEAIGLAYHKPTEAELQSGSYYQYEPQFTRDLNAIQQAIQHLDAIPPKHPGYYNRSFVSCLQEVLGYKSDCGTMDKWAVFDLITATAAQRAEAFLRTIGKWKD